MYPRIGRTLGSFHHKVACQIKNMQPNRDVEVSWIYPLLDAAMGAMEMKEVDTYILCCQNTFAQYVSTRPIMELCLKADERLEEQVSRR